MKRKIFLLVIFCFVLSFGQNRKGQFQLEQDSKSHSIYVCFSKAPVAEDIIRYAMSTNSSFKDFVKKNDLSFIYDFELSDRKLSEMVESSKKNKKTGESIEKLKRIYKVESPVKSNKDILKLAEDFEKFPEIEYASLMSNEPITPPFINTYAATPNLESSQTYLLDNPGINVNYAWSRGITGQNVRIRDVEYGFHKSHEMLVSQNAIQFESGVSPNPSLTNPSSSYYSFLDHGTSVMSIMGSAKDNIGLSGTAYNATEMKGYLEWTTTSYNRASAVSRSINASQAGDIILYEMQTGGQNSNYVLAEYNNVIWDLTKAATDSGIIVIAAAGNGNENLDASFYSAYNARGNSGAIVVGAGSNTTQHSKLSFSTYGSRVDVQGWGQNVLAAGYGSWAKYDNDNNRTYNLFNGTSSATPIVASAAILIQSFNFQQTGQFLSPSEMRSLLVNTGIPQGGNLTTKIGPLPNIKAAIESLENSSNTLSTKNVIAGPLKIEIYPNPTSDYIFVRNTENATINFEVLTLAGQIVLKGKTSSDKKINITNLPKGNYLIIASDSQRKVIEKLIKQ
ncbi:S8 family peptidase [Chryseobacterium proteolyticum]|uniref:S8 family peptidase n=1 Tax=Chryseobacterium proteolyticum TaxID=118127 RepID=UPI00398372B1